LTTATALIPAAGRGERFGRATNKVFALVAGKPILAHTLSVFEACEAINEIVLVIGRRDIEAAGDLVGRFGFAKVTHIVPGGAQRQDSVRLGLREVSGDIVAIHDAARPMVTREIIEQSIQEAERTGACIAAVGVIDTIKSASPDKVVTGTVDRSDLYAVQTPQTFRTELIREAFERAFADGFHATDDAALVERMGRKVSIVPGSYDNIKITTPADLQLATLKLGGGEIRTGFGYDVHALAKGRRLVLGGVEIPCEMGLAGHSDADVILHAIADALLGAAAMGDIGRHFPDTDPKYQGISSLKLLAAVGELLTNEGWKIVSIDATLAAERPKIAGYVPGMISVIARRLGIDEGRVSIKGTTTEKLGFVGRGEGMACQAVANLSR